MKTVTIKNVTLGSGSPKIIVPLVGKNEVELLDEAKHLLTIDCDLIEWRVDFFDQVTDFMATASMSKKIAEILSDKPLLLTFRTKKEGGELDFSDDQYFSLYETVIQYGAIDLLDVELFMDEKRVQQTIDLAHQKEIKIVMCNHDFDKTPAREEIVSRLCKMQEKNADICKIAVMPQSSGDVLTLLEATNEMKVTHADRPIVTMSMGQLGMVSRMCGEVFGSAMTFGAAKKASAPGQVPVTELREILKTLAI
ncbi:type I 3-dehydroquinate dehydratase [Candidatus Enterococcus mansonii]|uniref:3-dehydroquinate dehydratase n=1 Tax=Candidatus Enterococcus mansonii TaxID=1834181 RepID=A0A242CK23_9ENTE|nr:type I 3-dehydroquinate dehydratase [Enterococcus sp. 4G2_DIV0659]OTO10575.1 3-dehydroquinate dehydratase, type I [Enterococcus sp. 4G2_DIV0659]